MKQVKETLFCDVCGQECKQFIRNSTISGNQNDLNKHTWPNIRFSIKMEYYELEKETRQMNGIKRESEVCKACQKEALEHILKSFKG